jgi:uncharacterized phage protein gp47/JayE
MGKLAHDYHPLGYATQIIGGADTLTDGTAGLKGSKLVVADTTVDGAYKTATAELAVSAVLLDDTTNGKPGRIFHGPGDVKVLTSAAISRGADVCASTSGRIKTAVAGAPRIGQALEAAAGADEEIMIHFLPKLKDS